MLYYKFKYKMFICWKHCYIIRNLHNHLCDQHTIICVNECHIIVKKYVKHKFCNLIKMQLLSLLKSLILTLKQFVETFKCSEKTCKYICINCKRIWQHCNWIHNWKHNIKNLKHWHVIHTQTFFINNDFRQYFIMQIVNSNNNNNNNNCHN